MRIVSINSHYQDGLGYQDYYLGREWKAAGHEVHFISSEWHFNFPDYNNTVRHIIGDRYVGPGIFENEYSVPVHRLKSLKIGSWYWLKGLRKKIETIQPNIIIMHGVFNFQTIRIAYYTKFNFPIIIDDHTTINVIRKDIVANIIFGLFRFLFSRKIYKRARRIIGISSSCIGVLDEKLGLHGSKVRLVPLGTDISLFFPDPIKRSKFRSTLDLVSEKSIIITYTGKMYDSKKIHILIDALNDVEVRSYHPVILLLVGNVSSDYKAIFKRFIENAQFRIIFKETVSQDYLPYIYNGSDLAVWPAHTTTSTIDASACGCPIICSDYMTERYKGGAGIGIKDGNIEDLKKALRKLIHSKELRVSMGNHGLNLVKEEFSWKRVSENFLNNI